MNRLGVKKWLHILRLVKKKMNREGREVRLFRESNLDQ